MKKLLIVESPAKIKTIKKFLGQDFKIMSTMGHVMDLPQKRLGVTINGSIDIEYVPLENKDKTIAEICKAGSTASEVYLAPDPDREGEIIAWHVQQELLKVTKNTDKIHRITFNEITEGAITNALQHPQKIDLHKVAAQQARRILDRWVGYEVSPILWKKIAPGLSAGRVQSVSLKLICDREEAIRAFKPEEYWSINALFTHVEDDFEAALTHVKKKKIALSNKKDTEKLVEKIKASSFIVEAVTDKKRSKKPLPPFMTSSLQQAAFNKLGFSVKKTMQLAQKLYEGIPLQDASTPVALITYMRTDSLRLSETAITQAREYIAKQFTKDYLPSRARSYEKGKGKAQDAHEAIRPINVTMTPDFVTRYIPKDAARLYELIWKRFVSCQMESAEYAQRQVVVGDGTFTFKATGSTLLFDGFLSVYMTEDEEKTDKATLPSNLKAKDPLDLKKVTPKQHFTQPPPKYTEASLVKELEKEGIGRPSTYATILSTIQARSYTTLDTKKRFTPTDLGMTVTKMLVENLPHIMDVTFTAHMEEDLDKIAQGELDRDVCLREFYRTFEEAVTVFKGTEKKRVTQPTDITCPACNKTTLLIRFGKSGEFLGCNDYPDCSFTSNFTRDEQGTIVLAKAEEPKILSEQCPLCEKPLRQVIGKFGPFIACSGYPECTYIYQRKASFACPTCKTGDIVEKKWRGGKFWGCNNYPKCKFAVFSDIEETPCPTCSLPFMVKKTNKEGTVTLSCFDKSCDAVIKK